MLLMKHYHKNQIPNRNNWGERQGTSEKLLYLILDLSRLFAGKKAH